ncbi:MAG: hypothetical protein IPN06_09835 [Burkholderiales bacterium]|nr:hypothetical protein [Burkholderiales bacterium]
MVFGCAGGGVELPESFNHAELKRRRVLHERVMPFEYHQLHQYGISLLADLNWRNFAGKPVAWDSLVPKHTVQG